MHLHDLNICVCLGTPTVSLLWQSMPHHVVHSDLVTHSLRCSRSLAWHHLCLFLWLGHSGYARSRWPFTTGRSWNLAKGFPECCWSSEAVIIKGMGLLMRQESSSEGLQWPGKKDDLLYFHDWPFSFCKWAQKWLTKPLSWSLFSLLMFSHHPQQGRPLLIFQSASCRYSVLKFRLFSSPVNFRVSFPCTTQGIVCYNLQEQKSTNNLQWKQCTFFLNRVGNRWGLVGILFKI